MADTFRRTAPRSTVYGQLCLWPSSCLANAMLSSLVFEENAEQEQMTANYLDQNLLEDENPAVL